MVTNGGTERAGRRECGPLVEAEEGARRAGASTSGTAPPCTELPETVTNGGTERAGRGDCGPLVDAEDGAGEAGAGFDGMITSVGNNGMRTVVDAEAVTGGARSSVGANGGVSGLIPDAIGNDGWGGVDSGGGVPAGPPAVTS